MAEGSPRNSSHNNQPKIVKRFRLPSGKPVDIISWVNEPAAPKESSHNHTPLCKCPRCGHNRVQPTGWSEVGTSDWHVTLRCPDCEERRGAIFGQDELNEFDAALDEGTRSVAYDLDLLARANMADDIDRFIEALNADHIVPEDF